jgi:hypothetical protein
MNQTNLDTKTQLLLNFVKYCESDQNVDNIKTELQNLLCYCEHRQQVLMDHVFEGYEKHFWIFKCQ